MKKAKMAEALKTEFNGLYKNNEDLHWINYVIASGKRNAIYQVAMTDKPTLNALKTTLTTIRCFLSSFRCRLPQQ